MGTNIHIAEMTNLPKPSPQPSDNPLTPLLRMALPLLVAAWILFEGAAQAYLRSNSSETAAIRPGLVLTVHYPEYLIIGDDHIIQMTAVNTSTLSSEPITITVVYMGKQPLGPLPDHNTSIRLERLEPGARATHEMTLTIWDNGKRYIESQLLTQPLVNQSLEIWVSDVTGNRKIPELSFETHLLPVHYLRRIHQIVVSGLVGLIIFLGRDALKVLLPKKNV
jgi:hypothetical protein